MPQITAADGKVINYDSYFVDTDENVIFTLNGVYVGIQNRTLGKIFAIVDIPQATVSNATIITIAAIAAVVLFSFVK